MNVEELRTAIAHLPGDLCVEVALPSDELPVTCLTSDKRYLRLRLDNTEISVGETTLHDEGRVPDRETFWLVERKVSPPQYVGMGSGWTNDPWRATRFATERQAHDHWRTMTIFRDESAPVEHLFINRK